MPNKDKKLRKAVAIKYNPAKGQAPIIVAKGQGETAQVIINKAREHRVPVTQNPPVAEVLNQLELGEEIPPELYQAVAEILAFVYLLEAKNNCTNF